MQFAPSTVSQNLAPAALPNDVDATDPSRPGRSDRAAPWGSRSRPFCHRRSSNETMRLRTLGLAAENATRIHGESAWLEPARREATRTRFRVASPEERTRGRF